jgi:hypothetical protein
LGFFLEVSGKRALQMSAHELSLQDFMHSSIVLYSAVETAGSSVCFGAMLWHARVLSQYEPAGQSSS